MFDVLIKGGMVVDGTGGTHAFKADVGLTNGKIAAVGSLSKERAHETIDAKGKIVCPGFIDIQNHSDSYGALLRNPSLDSLLLQGITSILVGHGGSSLSPLLRGSLASLQKWTDITGVNVDWRSTAEFLNIVNVRGLGPNVATLVGHGTLRRDLVGDEMRPLTSKEQVQLETLLKRSIKEGAWGISVGLEYTHERAAQENEILSALAAVSAARGVSSFHLREEGTGFDQSLAEVLEYAQKSGIRTKISRLKIENEDNPSRAEEVVSTIEKARANGADIFFDVYPYDVSASTLYLLLPSWLTDGGRSLLLERLRSPELRAKAVSDLKNKQYAYKNIHIASSVLDRTLIGKSIADLAHGQGREPEELLLDTVLASQDQMIVFFKNTSLALFEVFAKCKCAMIATNGVGYGADSKNTRELPHPRSFGTVGRVLGHYVREQKLFSLEEAIHKMSGLPAMFLGIKDRGLIHSGNYADIVVFDPHTVADGATYENPYTTPSGIEHVLVNGTKVVSEGESTQRTPGVVLFK